MYLQFKPNECIIHVDKQKIDPFLAFFISIVKLPIIDCFSLLVYTSIDDFYFCGIKKI